RIDLRIAISPDLPGKSRPSLKRNATEKTCSIPRHYVGSCYFCYTRRRSLQPDYPGYSNVISVRIDDHFHSPLCQARDDRDIRKDTHIMPLGLHLPELLIILAVALLIFGPKKLPEIVASIGIDISC